MKVGRHHVMMSHYYIRVGNNSHEKVKTFKCLDPLLIDLNSVHKVIKCILKAGNSCCYSAKHFCLL
jgi:hypothetical protein